MSPSDLWRFLLIGYPFTILIETPVLLFGLSQRHSIKRRIFAGVWLTACTYPQPEVPAKWTQKSAALIPATACAVDWLRDR